MAVIDSTATSKLIQQVNEMKKQFAVLEDTRDLVQEQVDGIGKMSKQSMTIINTDLLSGDLLRSASCLLPDFSSLYPDIDWNNLKSPSICQKSETYERALLADPTALEQITGFTARTRYRDDIRSRRTATVRRSAIDGLSQSDQALEASRKTTSAARELKRAAGRANNVNERLAVQSQISLAQLEATNQTNQLLAQLLRVQSATAMALHVPLDDQRQSKSEEKKP